ncbi:PAP2 domain-containing protein [Histoplasma capsulatum]|uniref:PAP2 domain-containing protein n=1 Tax=Ajellomyces capsulatus TaxID=5037 RepID=A0A8A1MJR0_AJECA|nr:conserved hypothetical protein [Histoplasma mississippiense (nom. inval.)]EDN09996.1 conserved hypothetical protein [Histoplasma mississippiense (nom. inval.)]QSS66331.1 PAP2 domain-containing protein [Histoplasma capsulatum]
MPDGVFERNNAISTLASRPGILGALVRFWSRSYAADYVSLILLCVGLILIQIWVRPFNRMFTLDDVAIQLPFALVERVPFLWSITYAGVTPLIIIILWALMIRRESHFAHVSVLGLLVTLILTSFLTDIIKNAAGRPRPDLLARCRPQKGTPAHQLVTSDVCGAPESHQLDEGWRSFPSGHSSFAFGGLGYLFMFFAGQLHVFQPRTGLACFLFALSPLLGALMIAMSRLADYRHDVYDVTAGALLGLSVAYSIYRRYFPTLLSVDCHNPYNRTNIPLEGFHRVARDEEERLVNDRATRSPTREFGRRDTMREIESGRD